MHMVLALIVYISELNSSFEMQLFTRCPLKFWRKSIPQPPDGGGEGGLVSVRPQVLLQCSG